MANPHSTVIYVEPNSMDSNTMLSGATSFEKAPSLEDYCIALNLEVEVCSRNRTSNDVQSEVLIVSWDNKNDKVSFMGGTKIGGYHYGEANGAPTRKSRLDPNGIHKDSIYNALTTYYADMYVGDLVDYGTTEMVGIKSVNIEYLKSCVPTITIQFTDVRGLSLFQPTELSRFNTFNGINGIDISNVAQSFFQCFYKMPLPKFTIYIKGFYGEPVSYEMMCDKFDTDFNSETGNFDCTAHFIGYSYSFMTDVSLDALICAPYSDYVGKDYWQQKVNSGEFFLYGKNREHQPMLTLCDVKYYIEKALATANNEAQDDSITHEEDTHEEEILKLKGIMDSYKKWYESLFSLVQERYGKEYCFLFKEKGDDGCYYRILILTNNSSIGNPDLSEDYLMYPDSFKKINRDVYATVNEYNSSGYRYKLLNNVSLDFSVYSRQELFRDAYVTNDGNVVLNGFSDNCVLPRQEIISVMVNGNGGKKLPYTVYGADGTDQYKDAFVIEVDYSDIKQRLNALKRDAERKTDDKTKERAIRLHNDFMFKEMKWYPTLENFTRIMLAHLETLMAMMYKVSDEIGSNRRASDVGLATKDLSDVNQNEENPIVPPFPRVTEENTEDGITKVEDKWVGDLSSGNWKEIDIVNGLLNAVEEVQGNDNAERQVLESISRSQDEGKPLVKYPLTPFDFFVTKNVYGEESDIATNPNAFAGKVAMRMYTILALNNFEWESKLAATLGELEAENFYDRVRIDKKFYDFLDDGNNQASVNADNVLSVIKSGRAIGGDPIPWGQKILFNAKNELDYNSEKLETKLYPIQNFSFDNLDVSCKVFQAENDDITYQNPNITSSMISQLYNSSNKGIFNSLFIEDDFNKVNNMLSKTMENAIDNPYEKIYNRLVSGSVKFNDETFASLIKKSGKTSFKKSLDENLLKNKKIIEPTDINNETKNLGILINGKKYDYSLDDDGDDNILLQYVQEAKSGNIVSFTLTEAFGIDININKEKKTYSINNNSHFFHFIRQEALKDELGDYFVQFFIMTLDCIDYKALSTYLKIKGVFRYVPKLAVLQIGAILSTLNDKEIKGSVGSKLKYKTLIERLPVNDGVSSLIPYLNDLKPLAKIAYIRYFKNWAKSNYSVIKQLNKEECYLTSYVVGKGKDYGKTRKLFDQTHPYVKTLTNSLMSPVLLANTNSCFDVGDELRQNRLRQNKSNDVMKTYLDAFIKKLKQLYGIYQEDEDGNLTLTTKKPKNSTKDMKKELYRYLKLLYDKWVPSNRFDSWNYEKFFDYSNAEDTKNGHLFHFIDSYYNKIGDKLLVNPIKLAEKLKAAFDDNNGDISIMMLGFMADIYAQNKCMLLSLQNFMDLSKRDKMYQMFKPISFVEMESPHKHPDFVVVYPYEPSKYLNINNSEYNNDGFMLNTEYETPKAIRSRGSNGGEYYNIPAFGVSYGKQYQSYFKKINVNTKSPIATQQSILAKHSILRSAHGDKKNGVVGQDLYDVYTTQSYTCTVEMMGCAWVQPLMYFVLLNVPMFRGSYMIFKVTHRIVPGDMSTTFMGTRMCNVSNTLVKDIFTDNSDFSNYGDQYGVSTRQKLANVDNDCPYKVYPLVDNENLEISGDEKKDGLAIMRALKDKGYNDYAAAGIVGNMYVESYDYDNTKKRFKYDLVKEDTGGLSGGLCMWHNENLIALSNNISTFGTNKTNIEPSSTNISAYSSKLRAKGLSYQIDCLKETMTSTRWIPYKFDTYNKEATSPTIAARLFQEKYERGKGNESQRQGFAEVIYKEYKANNTTASTNADDKELNNTDIRMLFIKALRKSCESTTAVGASSVDMTLDEHKKDRINITGDANKLAVVFDMILNGYYDYVKNLYWITKDYVSLPTMISVDVSNQPSGRKILITDTATFNSKQVIPSISPNWKCVEDSNGEISCEIHDSLRMSLTKKYKNLDEKIFTLEVPQCDKSVLNDKGISSCDSVVGGSGILTGFASQVTNEKMKKVLSRVNNICLRHNYGNKNSWYSVRGTGGDRPSPEGKCTYGPSTWYHEAGKKYDLYFYEDPKTATYKNTTLPDYGMKLVWHGTIAQAKELPNSSFRPGDVSTQYYFKDAEKQRPSSHGCMWTGKDWRSDFVQNGIMANKNYFDRNGDYSVCIWRHPDLQEPNTSIV